MRDRGFTLVELAIVLGVVSLVAAYVIPDFIEMARNNLAEKAARDMIQVQDAGRWFYHDMAEAIGDPEYGRWPGEAQNVPPANPLPVCTTNALGPRNELIGQRYLANEDFLNPWDLPYQVNIDSRGLGIHNDCQLVVSTDVPLGVAGVIKTFMPDAGCEVMDSDPGLCPGNPGAGNDRCCSRAVRPGYEAALQDLVPLACDNMLGAEWDNSIGDGECNTRINLEQTGLCYWAREGSNCAHGYVVVGQQMTSTCGKGCEETQNYCCKGVP